MCYLTQELQTAESGGLELSIKAEAADDSAAEDGMRAMPEADDTRATAAADASTIKLENGDLGPSGKIHAVSMDGRSMENGTLEHGEGMEVNGQEGMEVDGQGLLQLDGYLALDNQMPLLAASQVVVLPSYSEETAGAVSPQEQPSIKVSQASHHRMNAPSSFNE